MDLLQQLIKENAPEGYPPAERLYLSLLQDILTGVIAKDDRLNESVLTKKYKVSRTPLRAVFHRLETEGIVYSVKNRGTFARGFSDVEAIEMMRIKGDLEVLAVNWGIRRLTEKKEESLKDLFAYMEFYTHKEDIPKMIDINLAFHKFIYKASGSALLEKTLLTYQTYANFRMPSNYFAPGFLDKVLEEHRHIYAAYLAHDPSAGARTMKTHMSRELKRLTAFHTEG